MSRSTAQLARQQRCRAVRMASIADRPDRYPYESAWNLGSSSGSRYRRTTSWAMRSVTVGIPSGRVPPFAFGMSTRRNRRWKVAPRGQPVPQLVEVVSQIGLKFPYRLSIYASRSLVGLHFLESLPDLSLRDVERLCLSHAAPPITGWPPAKAGYRCPFGPAPLQDFQPYCAQLRPCVLHWSIDPNPGHRFERFPSHQDDRFPLSLQKPVSESRRLRAGCRLGRASSLRPSLSRDDHLTSVSTSTMPFRPFIDVCFRSSLR